MKTKSYKKYKANQNHNNNRRITMNNNKMTTADTKNYTINDIAAGTKTAITGMDWFALIMISFILPAVICPIFSAIGHKLGWVGDGDMTLA